jgi:predicted RNase H-like HicB family nuclease
METKKINERLNYIITKDGNYVGYPVNITGVVVQAKSKEDLIKNAKESALAYLEFLKRLIDQDEPFELKELNIEEWENYKSRL